MKKFRLSASYRRSLFSLVVACALVSGAGACGWAQDKETQAVSPDSISVGQQDKSPAPVNTTGTDSAPPSTPAVEVGQPASTSQAEPLACSSLTASDALPVVFVPGTAGSYSSETYGTRFVFELFCCINWMNLKKIRPSDPLCYINRVHQSGSMSCVYSDYGYLKT
jgi:hypothetical protein